MIPNDQMLICKKYKAPFLYTPMAFKLGIALNVKNQVFPINGLCHPIKGDMSGWYIWAGEEFSKNLDIFVPLHMEHLLDWCPENFE